MTNDCIFCKIIKKEIPAKIVYEDKLILAFLDVNPVSAGHTLIVPKIHSESIFDIPEKTIREIISIAKQLSINYKQKLNLDGVNLLNANGKDAQQSVFHFHMHLVPRYKNDGMDLWFQNISDKKIDLDKVFEKVK